MKKLTASLIPVLLVGALACSKSEPPPPPPTTVAAAPTTTLPAAARSSPATLGTQHHRFTLDESRDRFHETFGFGMD